MGLEGIVSKRKDFDATALGPVIRLAQDEEPGLRGGEARGRRGLGAGEPGQGPGFIWAQT